MQKTSKEHSIEWEIQLALKPAFIHHLLPKKIPSRQYARSSDFAILQGNCRFENRSEFIFFFILLFTGLSNLNCNCKHTERKKTSDIILKLLIIMMNLKVSKKTILFNHRNFGTFRIKERHEFHRYIFSILLQLFMMERDIRLCSSDGSILKLFFV